MSQNLTSAVAVIGIDIGENSSLVVDWMIAALSRLVIVPALQIVFLHDQPQATPQKS